MEGKISSANWSMPSLISLVMSQPTTEEGIPIGKQLELEGGIPKSFKNSCNLRELDLREVKLKQDTNEVLEILSLPGCTSNWLEELTLDYGQLFGNLTTTNQHFGRFMSLKSLNLRFNNLSGTLPVSLGRLKNLKDLYLHSNSLAGDVLEAHFENLNDLQVFYASGNQLKLSVSPDWIPHFHQLVVLDLGSWYIGPQFPTWLRSLKNLYSLGLSSSGISSTIPVWFWNFSSNFQDIDLSHNQLHGVLPSTLSQFSFSTIDLSANGLHGPLPLVSSNLYELDLSNNSFSGSISRFLCPPEFNSSGVGQNLNYLNLGQNHLQGEIPNCFAAWSLVSFINLSNNKLSGELPQSLKECTGMVTIDVGENKLMGNISNFVTAESLSGMRILILCSNKLSGQIPENLCHVPSLYVLDLANNFFDGIIPSCLGNLSAMTTMNESTGLIKVSRYSGTKMETALLWIKGNMLEYSTNLGFVRSLDFSNNKLGGKIPDEITSLHGLVFLNLSHNALSGGIPKNIGFLKELGSMDLSVNQLSGEISQSISNLTSLGKLNLSYNRLSGRIPFGNQIQTFDSETSYC